MSTRMLVRRLSGGIRASLNYSKVPPAGVQLGRYIGRENSPDDVLDALVPSEVEIRDARGIDGFRQKGFENRKWPTEVADFGDAADVRRIYYKEMAELVKAASGAEQVYIFDHTIREAGATSLNTTDATKAAATVARVHTDYTAKGAPRRLEQLVRGTEDVWDAAGQKVRIPRHYLNRDYSFINIWRSIDREHLVHQRPMAFLDEASVEGDEIMTYELRFPRRTGETYALQYRPSHSWYYYPKMHCDECVVFKGYDTRRDLPRFVYHTAFDDPTIPETAPKRKSIEVRTIAFFASSEEEKEQKKTIFYDMKHSNNAARIRLWNEIASEKLPRGLPIATKMITYPDLQTSEFTKINPLRKVPALIEPNGATVFESDVILRYLEDKYGQRKLFTPKTAEARQKMDLIIRCHDLYVASPNCTAPGFSHSQGSMYLSFGFHGEARGMDIQTRAAKLQELWKQLTWLEDYIQGDGNYLVKAMDRPSLADLTWYPTCVFMEFMLPRVFRWPHLFDPAIGETSPTPRLATWFHHLTTNDHPAFPKTRDMILEYWSDMESKGQFLPIIEEINQAKDLKWQYP